MDMCFQSPVVGHQSTNQVHLFRFRLCFRQIWFAAGGPVGHNQSTRKPNYAGKSENEYEFGINDCYFPRRFVKLENCIFRSPLPGAGQETAIMLRSVHFPASSST